MAKVSGPLMSMSASGKIGDAIVFSIWKGTAYVRQWLKPANPQSESQGDHRIMIGGTGRACGKVSVAGGFNTKLIASGVVPSGQSKQSYLVKYILDHYLSTVTLYEAELAELTGCTAYTSWQAGGADAGIVEFDLSYATTAPYDAGLGIRLLYKTQQALGFTGAVYTVTLASMTAADIDAFVAEL